MPEAAVLIDFPLLALGPVSAALRQRGCHRFAEAVALVHALPYGRNRQREDALALLNEQRGTCSTKHALLKRAADENGQAELELRVGIYAMNARNTPKARPVLAHHGLSYLPEAHCYLVHGAAILDATTRASAGAAFAADLLTQTVIEPGQAGAYKEAFHRRYLQDWLARELLPFSPDELWTIRKACILALSS